MTATKSPRIEDDVEGALAACRQSLDEYYPDFLGSLPDAPKDSQSWFELLRRFSSKGTTRSAGKSALVRIRGERPAGNVEHFALVQAFQAAVPRMAALPLEDEVKRLYFNTCRQVAFPTKGWERHFDLCTAPFHEMAKLATLGRFPAGQLSFDITAVARSWMLEIHPLELERFLREAWSGMGGLRPVAVPHLFHWRDNPLVMLPSENERSLWRIAKCIERQPEVRGLVADSWLYAAQVGEQFPHLAWLRDFYADQGASIFEMEPSALDSGFLVGSAKRRKLYEQGQFHPRRTLVLWRRQDMLAWASAHPELGDPHAPPRPAPPPARIPQITSPRCIDKKRFTLLNGSRLLNHHPRIYIMLTLILPSLLAGLAATGTMGGWAFVPVFLMGIAIFWLFQYFCLQ